jgi:hypothetical protein
MPGMRWICAWCQSDIPSLNRTPSDDDRISHGICVRCADALLAQNGIPLQSFIEKIDTPILVVDDDVRVQSLNRAASDLLRHQPDLSLRPLAGTVFDCIHAHQPEGCGRTVHCSGCAIRLAVAQTFKTGQPQIDVPATLSFPSDSPQDAQLLISTFKSGEAVALRVQEL